MDPLEYFLFFIIASWVILSLVLIIVASTVKSKAPERAPRCRTCRYDLTGIVGVVGACPECGERIPELDMPDSDGPWPWLGATGFVMLALTPGVFCIWLVFKLQS